MKQLRTIKRKSINPLDINAAKILANSVYNTQELAKAALIDISDTVLIEPDDDPFKRRSVFEQTLPTSRKTIANVSIFTESHSASLPKDVQHKSDAPKHRFLLRKRDYVGSPLKSKQKKINYIEYSYSPRKYQLNVAGQSKKLKYQQLRGGAVYVAKMKQQPVSQVKYSRFIMCEEIPVSWANPKIQTNFKRITKDNYRPIISSSVRKRNRSDFDLDTMDDSDIPVGRYSQISKTRKQSMKDNRLNVVDMKLENIQRPMFGVSPNRV